MNTTVTSVVRATIATLLTLAVVMSAGTAATAAESDEPRMGPAAVLSPATAQPGDTITVTYESGDDWGWYCGLPEAVVVVSVDGWPPVTGDTSTVDGWTAELTVPSDAEPGAYDVAYTCDLYWGSIVGTPTPLTVVAADDDTPDDDEDDDERDDDEESDEDATPRMTLSTNTLTPGGTVDVSASGFAPGEDVTITLHSDPIRLATVTASATGEVTARVTIPSTAPAGAHTIRLVGLSSGLSAELPVTVQAQAETAAPDTGGRTPLPATGSDPSRLVGLAALAVAAGGAALVARRVRLSRVSAGR